jgi:hypothetical protein
VTWADRDELIPTSNVFDVLSEDRDELDTEEDAYLTKLVDTAKPTSYVSALLSPPAQPVTPKRLENAFTAVRRKVCMITRSAAGVSKPQKEVQLPPPPEPRPNPSNTGGSSPKGTAQACTL